MILTGKIANGGIAIGKSKIYSKKDQLINQDQFLGIEEEKQRYRLAKAVSIKQLQELYDKALKGVGAEHAQIFNVHIMMVEDMDYTDSVMDRIESQKLNAEAAVLMTGNQFADMFSSMDDDYMRERASDVKDISERLINSLNGNYKEFVLEEEAVIFADDLTPSETIKLDKKKVLAFVTTKGSVNSHTAILSRMMNIPAIVSTNFDIKEIEEDKLVIVNGSTGEVIIDPDMDTLQKARILREEEKQTRGLLLQYLDRESITTDGKRIFTYANIGDSSDVDKVLEHGADGIGLFRSEFLFLGKDDYPTEEEQFQAYKMVAERMAGRKVIIRTLDIGADKQADYFKLDGEENPALGYRAIRICLTRPDIFKTQLRAIYRASAYGTIAIMYPMIISVSEVRQIKSIVKEVKQELIKKGIAFSDVEQGIMIETPASVMVSDQLAKEVDFFSIGTNDLSQYTLAIDRQNIKLDTFYDSHHPAILKMIQMVIENGHKENCWVGICGELATDLTLTEKFIRMGIDELSVSPKFILPIRKIICNMNSNQINHH